MARQKRTSTALDEANLRARGLKAIDPALDFGNGVSLAALVAAATAIKAKLDTYNTLLLQADDALNELGAAEKAIAQLSSRLLAGVKGKYGADSSQYELAGGTRTSEIKRAPRKKATPAK